MRVLFYAYGMIFAFWKAGHKWYAVQLAVAAILGLALGIAILLGFVIACSDAAHSLK